MKRGGVIARPKFVEKTTDFLMRLVDIAPFASFSEISCNLAAIGV